jgi:putative SOS response-associated peptidase YedK
LPVGREASIASILLVLGPVDNFYEPCYETGKAVRTQIRLKSEEPFAIACLWDRWKRPETGDVVTSFSMLTVNA